MQNGCSHSYHGRTAQVSPGIRLTSQTGHPPKASHSPTSFPDLFIGQPQMLLYRYDISQDAADVATSAPSPEDMEASPFKDIDLHDRLITCLDAHIDPDWPIIPTQILEFQGMSKEDQDTFLNKPTLQQHHQAFIRFLKWMRDNGENVDAPPVELLNDLCYVIQAEDPKKRWKCGFKECDKDKGDTLEHLRSHLKSTKHLNVRCFRCDSCDKRFHNQHDLTRHMRKTHKIITGNDDEEAVPLEVGPHRSPATNRRSTPYPRRLSTSNHSFGQITTTPEASTSRGTFQISLRPFTTGHARTRGPRPDARYLPPTSLDHTGPINTRTARQKPVTNRPNGLRQTHDHNRPYPSRSAPITVPRTAHEQQKYARHVAPEYYANPSPPSVAINVNTIPAHTQHYQENHTTTAISITVTDFERADQRPLEDTLQFLSSLHPDDICHPQQPEPSDPQSQIHNHTSNVAGSHTSSWIRNANQTKPSHMIADSQHQAMVPPLPPPPTVYQYRAYTPSSSTYAAVDGHPGQRVHPSNQSFQTLRPSGFAPYPEPRREPPMVYKKFPDHPSYGHRYARAH